MGKKNTPLRSKRLTLELLTKKYNTCGKEIKVQYTRRNYDKLTLICFVKNHSRLSKNRAVANV